ncbi:MAG: NUDIX domain-containing protein [Chloroflexi bacterium]|nr:NUDIX domain-containing protein [Chloroflexota bacterium]
MADVIEMESMGGVVARTRGGDVEFVVCGFDAQQGNVVWGLPKGTPEDGETREQTALREVNEETGLQVRIDDFVGSIDYCFARFDDGAPCHKVVHFYLMSAYGGDLSLHDHEFDYVRWLPAPEALRTLTHDNEVRVVKNALQLISKKARTG